MIFLRVFLYISVFIVTVIYFLPTQKALDFIAKKYIQKHEITIVTDIHNDFLIHKGNKTTVNYKNKMLADFQTIEIKPFLAYNEINLNNVKLYDIAAGLFPAKIDKALARYTILHPTKILLEANGEFGSMNGYINVEHIFIELSPSNLMLKQFAYALSYFKKVDKKYIYEYAL